MQESIIIFNIIMGYAVTDVWLWMARVGYFNVGKGGWGFLFCEIHHHRHLLTKICDLKCIKVRYNVLLLG